MKIEQFRRALALFAEDLKGQARTVFLAEAAQQLFEETDRANAEILSRRVASMRLVDGRENAPLTSIKPGGAIVFRWSPMEIAADLAYAMILRASPVRSGEYRRHHIMLINGTEVAQGQKIGFGDRISITNLLPYARKIEMGSSSQAPDGVYESVAATLNHEIGDLVNVYFGYRSYLGAGPGGPKTRQGGTRTHAHDVRFPTLTMTGRY